MADYSIMAKLFAGRWVPGPKVEDGIRLAKHLDGLNIMTILNYLGESYKEKHEMENAFNVYTRIISTLKGSVNYQVSLKPTQIGLPDYPDVAAEYYGKIVDEAKKYGIFVWIDMEEYSTVDDTFKLYETRINEDNTGLCIQSYLKRSQKDVEYLSERGGKIRLVKGAYNEPEAVAYKSRRDTTNNFSNIMKYLFEKSDHFMIATHDMNLVDEAKELNKKFPRDYSVAMLNGIRNREILDLSREGVKSALYVPFGEAWMSYAIRRLKETSNLKLVMRSMLHGQKI